MPINIPGKLPAKIILEQENIFVMEHERALSQDIRPLDILIVNLMPEKEKTETQLLRLLGNTPLQVNITFLRMSTHESKNTALSHLKQFYQTFDEVKNNRYDGMIITGAPVEKLEFEDVTYWRELVEIMEWSKFHVTSTMHICWGAQAALYHHFQIPKKELSHKCFGIFRHTIQSTDEKLVMGFDEVFYAPHSRHTDVETKSIYHHKDLKVLSESDTAGIFLVISNDGKQIMVTGHPEYELHTLGQEYTRDRERGMDTKLPENYFPDDNPAKTPVYNWKSHASLLFSNWLNYYVYQATPYEWNQKLNQK